MDKDVDFNNSPPLEGWQPKADGVVNNLEYNNNTTSNVEKGEKIISCSSKNGPEFKRNHFKKSQPLLFINNIQINLTPIIDLTYNKNLKARAKAFRQAGNLPEVLFWMQVTKGNFHQIDFDRQRVIGNYIVDFYVKKLGLIIEIDGSSHVGKEEYDAAREEYLQSWGLKIYRVTVFDILHNMNLVIENLERFIILNYGVVDK